VLQAAGVIAFHVIDRYRVAAVPCAVALGVVAIAGWREAGRRERSLVAGAALLGISMAVLLPPPIGTRGQNPAGQHRMLAMEAVSRRAWSEAEAEMARAAVLNPSVGAYQFRLAMLRRMLGDEAGAQQAADAGYVLDPERGRVELGTILLAELPAASAEVCLESHALGRAKVDALHCAAVALHALGERARAEALLLQAIEDAPNAIDLWKALARVRWDAGDEEGAEQAYRRTAELMRSRHQASPSVRRQGSRPHL
jgi:tetratricopeptide (TPR) repeat protein